MTSVVPRSMPRIAGGPAAVDVPWRRRSWGQRLGVERHDGLGGRDVRDERAHRRQPAAPRGSAGPCSPPPRRRWRPAPARGPAHRTRAPARGVPGRRTTPSRSNGAMRISPTAPARSSSRGHVLADRRGTPGAATDPDERDIEPAPQVEHRAHAGVRLERVLRGGVVDQPGHHEAVGLRPERLRDPAERLALRTRRPVAAGQRHDRGARRASARRPGRRRRHSPRRRRRSRRSRRRGSWTEAPARQADRPSGASGPRVRPRSGPGGPRRGRSSGAARRAAGDSAAVWSMIRISTMPSARARFSRRLTCGRVTPSRSAIAFCVSPSS